jgi:hypothetical protein
LEVQNRRNNIIFMEKKEDKKNGKYEEEISTLYE